MEANNDIEVCVACGKADGTLAFCRRCKRLACPNCPCVCDPAVEAAVAGIAGELLTPGYDVPAANEPTPAERRRARMVERGKAIAAVYHDAHRLGMTADSRYVSDALATVRNDFERFEASDVAGPPWTREQADTINRQLAELRRTGQLDPLEDPDDPEKRCHRDGCQYPFAVCGCPRDPRFPPLWNREPSAELVGGAESIDWSAVVGACALVGLVVFFIVAVIVGAL